MSGGRNNSIIAVLQPCGGSAVLDNGSHFDRRRDNGAGREAGSIGAGKWRDVILLASDPLESLEALVKPSLVMLNGEIVFRKNLE